jgi:hypothetical protein
MEGKPNMWYYIKDDQRKGPISESDIRGLVENGTITRDTLVWREGMSDWQQAGSSYLREHFTDVPPLVPTVSTTPALYSAHYDPKSFKTLWLWFTLLSAIGYPLCIIYVGIPIAIAGGVLMCILLYRFWAVIQDGNVRTTPGKAVGFLFIPLFNFYWGYVAWVGLTKDINTYCRQRNINAPEVNEGLALTWFILCFLQIIPFVGILVGIANLIIIIILTRQLATSAEAIINAKQ